MLLLPGPLELGVAESVKVPFMGQIDLFKDYLFSIGLKRKKTKKEYETKHVNMNV